MGKSESSNDGLSNLNNLSIFYHDKSYKILTKIKYNHDMIE